MHTWELWEPRVLSWREVERYFEHRHLLTCQRSPEASQGQASPAWPFVGSKMFPGQKILTWQKIQNDDTYLTARVTHILGLGNSNFAHLLTNHLQINSLKFQSMHTRSQVHTPLLAFTIEKPFIPIWLDYLLGRGTATSRGISVAGEEEVNFESLSCL